MTPQSNKAHGGRVGAGLNRLGLSLFLAASVVASAARAEILPPLKTALETCLSRDLTAEARFAQLEADGWQFMRDTPQTREMLALRDVFFVQYWGAPSDWRSYADQAKARFDKLIAEPPSEVAYQAENYGATFSAIALMTEVKSLASASLEHPEISSLLIASFTIKSDGSPEFSCKFDMTELPDPGLVAALLPDTAMRRDNPQRPGLFSLTLKSDGDAGVVLSYIPLTGTQDYDAMLTFLGATYGYDGLIETFVTPVKASVP